MQNQNSEIVFPAKVSQISDSKFDIKKCKRKCPFRPCSKIGCRKFWHKPCTPEPGFVAQLWPTILAVGISEIFFGVILIVVVACVRQKYDMIYGADAGRIISITSILGLMTLTMCGVMLLVSLIMDIRKIMWIRIMTSTGLGAYVVILSILKMHFALLANERFDTSSSPIISTIMSDAGMLEIFTLLGAGFHLFGDIAVFTYFNIRYLQPELFYKGQVERI